MRIEAVAFVFLSVAVHILGLEGAEDIQELIHGGGHLFIDLRQPIGTDSCADHFQVFDLGAVRQRRHACGNDVRAPIHLSVGSRYQLLRIVGFHAEFVFQGKGRIPIAIRGF